MIYTIDGICKTYTLVLREPRSKPSNLQWQQHIKIVLCYFCTHNCMISDSTNLMASSDFSVWKRYWSTNL